MFVYLGGVIGYRAGVMWGGGRGTVIYTKAFRKRKLRYYLLNDYSLCSFISVYMHYQLKPVDQVYPPLSILSVKTPGPSVSPSEHTIG